MCGFSSLPGAIWPALPESGLPRAFSGSTGSNPVCASKPLLSRLLVASIDDGSAGSNHSARVLHEADDISTNLSFASHERRGWLGEPARGAPRAESCRVLVDGSKGVREVVFRDPAAEDNARDA
jgi:hypothetical protein